MVKPKKLGTVTRMNFAKLDDVLEMPDLIEVQKKSYQWFLDEGLREVLQDVSPIKDYSDTLEIELVDYRLDDKPKFSEEECKERDTNFAAKLYVTVRLRNKSIPDSAPIQWEIFMGDFPIMTHNGTFIINGAERVIVSQIVRSPGMYYEAEMDKAGNKLLKATVIPYRGAWLEYETDANGVSFVRIDKTRKIPVTVLVRALGVGCDLSVRKMYGSDGRIVATLEKDGIGALVKASLEKDGRADILEIEKLELDLLSDPENEELRGKLSGWSEEKLAEVNAELDTLYTNEALKEVYKKLRPGEPATVDSATTLVHNMFFDPKRYDLASVGRYKFNKKTGIAQRLMGYTLSRPAVSMTTGEIVFDAGEKMDFAKATAAEKAGVDEAWIVLDDETEFKVFSNKTVFPEAVIGCDLSAAGIEKNCKVIYTELLSLLESTGGDIDEVVKLAATKEWKTKLLPKHITRDDIFASINYLVGLSNNVGTVDDIDHLGNRRLRCVGELLQNQMRIGFSRIDKIVKERMTIQESETLDHNLLINTRPVTTAIREFFGSSPLSQFMDQNNPLAELTHKRRISALGPGGLSRDRASFEVRDVHYTHYGRMCPIETPEGPNIGLISSLSTYAKINEYGFIEAPYRPINKETGVVSSDPADVVYMSADMEDNYVVAQANEPLDENNRFVNNKITVRYRSEILQVEKSKADYMDVSPKMAVSVATAMIPFLDHDDNSRALMGSNMQKQAVPLMVTEGPIVATGMEYKAGYDSGVVVIAEEGGIAEKVTADEIVIKTDAGQRMSYKLIKFKKSNPGTCINQRPIINEGEYIEKGRVIADGPATCNGEISLGKNALIGFMTWEGYNYEDAVLLNERLVRDDVYTSIHIEEYSHEARDTKLGKEEITRGIPNVGDDALKDLDQNGVVRKGTEVRAGDILVGKVTPKGEPELTAEERLLRAIFGEKSREVRDTSLRLPHGESGIVVDVRTFCRDNREGGGDELPAGVNKVVKVYIAQKRKISVGDKMAGRHGNKGVVSRILPSEDMPFLPDGTPLDIVLNPLGVPSRMNIGQVLEVHLGMAARKLGWKVMTPVFDGADTSDLDTMLEKAGMNPDGKTVVYDGRTGEKFDNPVTVGVMYYLKLHHLVDDKIHARSTGPYSLVTQQPLGGKAQFGGQRFGEMEVWALEAYGAAYTLQEILTVKSDDVTGRVKAYEAIVKGQSIPTPGVPESFKVLVKELQALCLNVKVCDENGNEIKLSELSEEEEEIRGNAANVYNREITEDMIGEQVADDRDLEEGAFHEPTDEEMERKADEIFSGIKFPVGNNN